MSPHAHAALALLAISCTSPQRAPSSSSSAINAEPPPTPSVSAASAAPSASAERPVLRGGNCDVNLPKDVAFSECTPKPRTLDYPDCRRYVVEREKDDKTCRPDRLSLTVTGYQSIADVLDVKVVWEAGAPPKARLVLDKVVASVLSNSEKPGTVVGTIVFDNVAPSKLLLGPGARGYTDQASAKVEK